MAVWTSNLNTSDDHTIAGLSGPFPSAPVVDNFNRANEGPPMTDWNSVLPGDGRGLKVLTNVVAGINGGSTENSAFFGGLHLGPQIDVYATISTKPLAVEYVYVGWATRPTAGATGLGDGYLLSVDIVAGAGNDTLSLYRSDLGTLTLLGGLVTQEITDGDKVGLRSRGSTHEFWYNGGAGWTRMATRTDSTYTTETAANLVLTILNTTGRLDDAGAGTIALHDLQSARREFLQTVYETSNLTGDPILDYTTLRERFFAANGVDRPTTSDMANFETYLTTCARGGNTSTGFT